MAALLTFTGAVPHAAAIDRWFDTRPADLASIARPWFTALRACGPGLRELMHDGCPTICIGDTALAYVNVYTAHVNVGFFRGASLPDPAGLLQGTGKFMRHVKLRPGVAIDESALHALIDAAYEGLAARLHGHGAA